MVSIVVCEHAIHRSRNHVLHPPYQMGIRGKKRRFRIPDVPSHRCNWHTTRKQFRCYVVPACVEALVLDTRTLYQGFPLEGDERMIPQVLAGPAGKQPDTPITLR